LLREKGRVGARLHGGGSARLNQAWLRLGWVQMRVLIDDCGTLGKPGSWFLLNEKAAAAPKNDDWQWGRLAGGSHPVRGVVRS
jgi:hypothetical protein